MWGGIPSYPLPYNASVTQVSNLSCAANREAVIEPLTKYFNKLRIQKQRIIIL